MPVGNFGVVVGCMVGGGEDQVARMQHCRPPDLAAESQIGHRATMAAPNVGKIQCRFFCHIIEDMIFDR